MLNPSCVLSRKCVTQKSKQIFFGVKKCKLVRRFIFRQLARDFLLNIEIVRKLDIKTNKHIFISMEKSHSN